MERRLYRGDKIGFLDGKWHLTAVLEGLKRANLERLPKGERDGLCIFWEAHRSRAWLVRGDFIDSEQSPAILFVGEESEAIVDLGSWPTSTFEFWKKVLDEDVIQIVREG